MEYTGNSLSIIDEGGILPPRDFDELIAIRDELEHGFEKRQMFRTEYEARHSVLVDAKFPTADAKYWQAIREQAVHFSELVSLSFEYRKHKVKLARTGIKKAKLQDKADRLTHKDSLDHTDLGLRIEDLTIEEERLNWILTNQKRTAEARMKEILQWHRIKEELLPHLEFSPDEVGDHQHKSYLLRFVKQAELIKQGQANLSGPEAVNLLSQLENAVKVPENKELVEEIYGDTLF